MTESVAGRASALADHYRIEREPGAGGMATVQKFMMIKDPPPPERTGDRVHAGQP